jgi:hypothetical protein
MASIPKSKLTPWLCPFYLSLMQNSSIRTSFVRFQLLYAPQRRKNYKEIQMKNTLQHRVDLSQRAWRLLRVNVGRLTNMTSSL